jgi:meiotically up-regulated gene 157 (Mug157) protein
MKKFNTKKIGALVGVGLVASLGAGVAIGSQAFPNTITEEVVVKEIVTQTVEVPVEVITEVIKTVEVDNENLGLVLQTAYDADGDLSIYTEDLFDDELDQVVDRIIQVNDWKSEAENTALSQFSRELDRQHDFDRRDVTRVKVEETSISGIDFKNKDAVVTLEVEFRYDSQLYTADVEVEFYDGKALPIVIDNVVLK